MVNPTKSIPDSFQDLVDRAIDRCRSGLSPPDDLSTLYDWLEGDGYDDLLAASGDVIGVWIESMATDHFYDSNLRDWEGIPKTTKITDADRIGFIVERISEAGGGGLGDSPFPSILKFPLLSSRGRPAVVGGYATMCGQGGPEFTWLGLFTDESAFVDRLRTVGIQLESELISASESELLKWWR
jgi:hypothetical protein